MKAGIVTGLMFASAAFALAAVVPAAAHSPSDPSAVGDIGKLGAASSLVLHSKVKKVTYRLSAAGANAGQVPFTFVTFGIAEVLHGKASGGDMTLRFIGGPDGRGGFMVAEGVPVFQAGDEDILFVSGNGEKGCALVMCEFGRYRVFKGGVYEAHGAAVADAKAGRIAKGGDGPDELGTIRYPAPSFDDLMNNPSAVARIKKLGKTIEQARASYEAQAPGMIEMRTVPDAASARGKPAAGMALTAFKSALKSKLQSLPVRATAGIANANAGAAIPAPEMIVAAPAN